MLFTGSALIFFIISLFSDLSRCVSVDLIGVVQIEGVENHHAQPGVVPPVAHVVLVRLNTPVGASCGLVPPTAKD